MGIFDSLFESEVDSDISLSHKVQSASEQARLLTRAYSEWLDMRVRRNEGDSSIVSTINKHVALETLSARAIEEWSQQLYLFHDHDHVYNSYRFINILLSTHRPGGDHVRLDLRGIPKQQDLLYAWQGADYYPQRYVTITGELGSHAYLDAPNVTLEVFGDVGQYFAQRAENSTAVVHGGGSYRAAPQVKNSTFYFKGNVGNQSAFRSENSRFYFGGSVGPLSASHSQNCTYISPHMETLATLFRYGGTDNTYYLEHSDGSRVLIPHNKL